MAGFLKVTTSEKKIGFLLIETFRKLFNTQSYGHLEMIQVAIYYLSGAVGRSLIQEGHYEIVLFTVIEVRFVCFR